MLLAILVAGAALRVAAWARDVPLWLDEAMLALNVMHLSPVELLGPLQYHQVAPWGFLLMAEGLAELMGPSEAALRLVPALASVAALFLFARFLWERYGLGPLTFVGVLCLAFLPTVLLEAGNFKPYSLDLAVACGLLLLWHRHGIGARVIIAGIIAPWLSLPSVFVLAGIGLAEIDRRWSNIAVAGLLWLVSFGAYWFISLRHMVADTYLAEFWSAGFAPGLSHLFIWLPHRLVDFFRQPALFVVPEVAAVLALLGLYRLSREDIDLSIVIIGTVSVLLVASALHSYPALERTLFFCVPLGLVAMAAGAEWTLRCSGLRRALAVGCIGALVAANAVPSLYGALFLRGERLQRPMRDYRAIVQRLAEKGPANVYIHHLTVPGFTYYAERLGLASRRDSVKFDNLPELGDQSAWIVVGTRWKDEPRDQRAVFDRWVRSKEICDVMSFPGIKAYQVCGEARGDQRGGSLAPV